jgi:hypothetical protein
MSAEINTHYLPQKGLSNNDIIEENNEQEIERQHSFDVDPNKELH